MPYTISFREENRNVNPEPESKKIFRYKDEGQQVN